MHSKPIRSHYKAHPWVEDREIIRRWQRGQTGFPMVDAGMRELWKTGWIQQSVRMIVASFLVEYLGVNWIEGHKWFHDTLVDQDTAINAMMWQNAGRCGIDQWNFVLDATSGFQDPTGSYVRRWCPELKHLPNKYLHKPWEANEATLRKAGVQLGSTYPTRILTDLKKARLRTKENALAMLRTPESVKMTDPNGYDLITIPGKGISRVFTRREFRNRKPDDPKNYESKDQKRITSFFQKDIARNKSHSKGKRKDRSRQSKEVEKDNNARRQEKKKARMLKKKFKEKTRGRMNGGKRALTRADFED
uniref:Cryptochrome/DNA photolyase FAD-binding domain-containing protein n=2 Tax=Amorphochlora amoebiformis TaxID=1561963 RepID=A0A7S0CTW0_9EUKA|mmetsp:Transcript_13686/g.21661  ORF Transcript_13686/g.21661 Transcript_13686/m.21661 type:complete len:305 (+) Transcript_13686:202-1116(+)